jgi:thioredoxin-related protein
MKKLLIVLAVFVFSCFAAACGGSENKDEEPKNDDNNAVSDDEKADDAEVADDDSEETSPDDDASAELKYPEVGASCNKNGTIAHNVIMYDELDNKHQLAEWYKENNPKSKLIWLIFSAYDCPPCRIMKEDLLEINKKEYQDAGFSVILVMNGLLSGPEPEKEPAKIASLKEMYTDEYPETGQFALYSYLRDQKVFRKYCSSMMGGSYPTSAFIDASTMEILEYMEGWDEGLLNQTENFIEMLLEEL